MVKYFHFHNKDAHFDEQLETHRCSHTHNNKRCNNKVCIGLNMCWIHSRSVLHLKVTTSKINGAGVGLYAFDNKQPNNAIVFRNKQKVCAYNGAIIDEDELNRRYGDKTAPYAVQINDDGRYEDAATHRGIGSLMNSPSGTKFKPNCRFSIGRDKMAYIVAVKNIKNGEELYLSYGRQYRFKESNVATTTNNKKNNI